MYLNCLLMLWNNHLKVLATEYPVVVSCSHNISLWFARLPTTWQTLEARKHGRVLQKLESFKWMSPLRIHDLSVSVWERDSVPSRFHKVHRGSSLYHSRLYPLGQLSTVRIHEQLVMLMPPCCEIVSLNVCSLMSFFYKSYKIVNFIHCSHWGTNVVGLTTVLEFQFRIRRILVFKTLNFLSMTTSSLI